MNSRAPHATADGWGDLDAQTDARFADSVKDLASEERRAGFPPWERKTGT